MVSARSLPFKVPWVIQDGSHCVGKRRDGKKWEAFERKGIGPGGADVDRVDVSEVPMDSGTWLRLPCRASRNELPSAPLKIPAWSRWQETAQQCRYLPCAKAHTQ